MISRRMFLTGAAASAAALTYRLGHRAEPRASAAPATCEIALENTSLPGTVHAYVTGRELGTDRWVLLKPDGGVYRPDSPGAPQTPLPVDCAIPLKAAGAGPVALTLPQMYGSRVYFVRDDKLDFFLNPGPSLVEPAFATPTDPNYGRTWAFAEFTFNTRAAVLQHQLRRPDHRAPDRHHAGGDATHVVARTRRARWSGSRRTSPPRRPPTVSPGTSWSPGATTAGVLRVVSPQNIMAPYFDRPDEMPFGACSRRRSTRSGRSTAPRTCASTSRAAGARWRAG